LEYERREQETTRLKDEVWQCSTPGERALQDLEKFMNHYFLINGRPDRDKATKPLALYGYSDLHKMRNRTELIPGLEVARGGYKSEQTVCIGRNFESVGQLANSITFQTQEKFNKKSKDKWEATMEGHHELVASIKKKTKKSQKARCHSVRNSTNVWAHT
jgi:hypothetical protein